MAPVAARPHDLVASTFQPGWPAGLNNGGTLKRKTVNIGQTPGVIQKP
jgi:hypothetical protein